MKTLKRAIILVLLASPGLTLFAREGRINPRYSYYTTENLAEILLFLPEGKSGQSIELKIRLNVSDVFQTDTTLSGPLLRVRIPLQNLVIGRHLLTGRFVYQGKTSEVQSTLVKLAPKKNGVRIDRLTGKLIVNDMPWFPFGFYCYSPVQPTLAEEEVVRGFNVISPYQNIDPGTVREREIYMDRCARLGMKVHYQLISVAGGGGVGSLLSGGSLSAGQRMSHLKAEIEHFRDHPALLAWYLSDEPTGRGVSPDSLQKMYDFVRELDPYHPISIVFDAPQRAREYADAMDIVMADPYPIPNAGVDGVGAVTEGLSNVFKYEKPVWIVPQAFGGGEWWGREPSPQEIRAMTYLALVRGATGIQYFIRHGLNGFPKSNVTWGECSRAAMEVAEIAPYLLDGTPIPQLLKEKDGVWTNGWKMGNETLILAVNAENESREFTISLPSVKKNAMVEVMFENRELKAGDNQVSDWIAPLGAQVYRIGALPDTAGVTNLLSDPGFENTLSYGVPAACYLHVGSDRGATAFLDTRTFVSGHHSLRLVTPEYQKGMGISFFPVSLNSGQSYRFSIFAKSDTTSWMPGRKPTFIQKLLKKIPTVKRNFMVKFGDLADQSFTPSAEWIPYTFYFSVPDKSNDQVKINPYLELAGQGTAWFDQMVLAEDPVIRYTIDQKKRRPEISITTSSPDVILRYNLEGRKPGSSDPEYINPVVISRTVNLAAGIFRSNTLLTWTVQTIKSHLAVGHAPAYDKKYATKYTAGGVQGLVDGQSGSRNYLDGRWQGFNGQDLRATIDLDTVWPVTRVSMGFLQDTGAWIFMPLNVEVEGSTDGKNFKILGAVGNQVDEKAGGAIRKDFVVEFTSEPVRYIRIKATNRKMCPDWHNGKGKPAFIFVDEIAVE